jgi:hypothetical protein
LKIGHLEWSVGVFNHYILRRNATRDLSQASFVTKPSGNRLVLMGNHWPSRLGGGLASEPYRIMAGETLSYFHQRTIEIDGTDQAVVVMGDFNDEPFDRSLVEYALSERVERRVKSKRSKKPYLLNLTWKLMGRDDSPFEVDQSSLEIIKFPEMLASSGGPKRFGRPSSASSFDDTGFSDHFPIAVVLEED